MKATQACALFLLILLLCPLAAQAGTLGPALSYNELLALVRQARDGDVLLVSGDLSATDEALVTPALLEITGDGKATLRHLHVSDSSIVFSNLSLLDSFTVDGVSNIELRTVRVEGASGQYGLSFVGGGTLLIDEDSSVAGGTGATGVSISQRGGDLYVSMEGSVRGGADGGSGMEVSPMTEYGTMMLAGNICGGDGTTMGGTGLNLFDLSGNAFITVAGSVRGGKGSVGGAGMQVVSIGDTVSIGVNGIRRRRTHPDGRDSSFFRQSERLADWRQRLLARRRTGAVASGRRGQRFPCAGGQLPASGRRKYVLL